MRDTRQPIAFYRFGDEVELPIHIYTIEELWPELHREPVFREAFITTYVFTGGREQMNFFVQPDEQSEIKISALPWREKVYFEEMNVNGHVHEVSADDVVITIPGEVWKWQRDTQLTGYCMVFDRDFIPSFLKETTFLARFDYLRADRHSPYLHLSEQLKPRILRIMQEMMAEQQSDIPLGEKRHIMQALLYEFLMLMARADVVGNEGQPMNSNPLNRHIDMFTDLVGEHFLQHHDVEYYASRMAVTPNYLNKIVHATLGISTKAYINGKLIDEASQLLIYTHLSLKEIAQRLCFEDVPYFVRFFGRHKGMSPIKFREIMQEKQQ